MNRKMWFYGASMVLLMLTTTYLAITTGSNSWEDLKGRQGACIWVTFAPKDAPLPGNCTFWNLCKDPTTTGTPGYCQTTSAETEQIFLRNQWSHGHIVKRKRDCRLSWFHCNDNGVIDTPGSLTECVVTWC